MSLATRLMHMDNAPLLLMSERWGKFQLRLYLASTDANSYAGRGSQDSGWGSIKERELVQNCTWENSPVEEKAYR